MGVKKPVVPKRNPKPGHAPEPEQPPAEPEYEPAPVEQQPEPELEPLGVGSEDLTQTVPESLIPKDRAQPPKPGSRTAVAAAIREAINAALPQIQKSTFLAVYARSGNLAEVARQTGIHRSTHQRWLREDEGYRVAFGFAQDEAVDHLEWEARRRAVEGVLEPQFFKGEECGYILKYSDSLLMFLLKANNPAKFRDRMEVTNPQQDVNKLAAMLGLPADQVLAALSGVRTEMREGPTPSPGDGVPDPKVH